MANPDIDIKQLLPQGATLQSGKYRVVRYLSSGNFGNTYIVENTGMHVQFAMKEFFLRNICYRTGGGSTVSISPAVDPGKVTIQREKFQKEAQRLYGLKSPHLVHVHDMFEENGTVYYVMDFVKGESLSSYMRRTGQPLSEEQTLYILDQLLNGLEEVHAKQIWHLDLKPDNVMIDKDGNVVIIDFGASKQVGQSGRYTGTTNILCYTPGYAPTEQVNQNMDAIGPWTDIYALGATLYNLLTGIDPVTVSPATLQFPPSVSKKTQQLVRSMMTAERTQRPQSIAEVRQLVSAPAASSDTSSPSRRWLPVAAAIAGIIAIAVLLVNFFSGGGTDVPEPVAVYDDQKKTESLEIAEPTALDEDVVPAEDNPAAAAIAELRQQQEAEAQKLEQLRKEREAEEKRQAELKRQQEEQNPQPTSVAPQAMQNPATPVKPEEHQPEPVKTAETKPATGSLSVNSNPSGATVLIDGKERGTTPVEVSNLTLGKHQLKVQMQGYEDLTQTVTVKEGQTSELILALSAKPEEPVPSKVVQQTQSAVSNAASSSVSSSASSQTFTVAGVSFKMVKVEGGSTGTFYIGESEVTQALWQAVMGNNPSFFKGSNRPVEKVSWNDCNDFISQLNIKTGKTFRLPKESEWEYAAKGGNKSRGYSWSGCNSEDELEQYAWYDKNAYSFGSSSENSSHPDYGTHNMKSKRPNELGLYDMSGNVWEWCQDSSGSNRVSRGGCWCSLARYCRVSYRRSSTPGDRSNYLGLRLAL